MLELVIIVFVIVFLSFFSSMLEAAIFSQSINKIALLKKKDPFVYNYLLNVKKNPSETIISIVILNNLANILGSIFIGSFIYKLFNSIQSFIFSFSFSFFIIIFCEIIPKTIGERYANQISYHFIYLLIFLSKLFKPITFILLKIIHPIYKKGTLYPLVSEEEIKELANFGNKEGVLKKKEVSLIQRALVLNDISVKNIMIPRIKIKALNQNNTIESIKGIILNFPFSKIPIYDNNLDQITGIVFKNDIFKILLSHKSKQKFPLSSLKSECLFIPENKSIDSVLEELRQIPSHTAIVIDEHGGTSGIITLKNILEELIGDIYDKEDELEGPPNNYLILSSNEIIALGTTSLEEIGQFFNIEFTNPYINLSKFLLYQFNRFPKVGESVTFNEQLSFTIGQTTKKTIERVRIQKLVLS